MTVERGTAYTWSVEIRLVSSFEGGFDIYSTAALDLHLPYVSHKQSLDNSLHFTVQQHCVCE